MIPAGGGDAAQDGAEDIHIAVVAGGRDVQQVGKQGVDVNVGESGQSAVRRTSGAGGEEDGAHLGSGVVVAVIAAVLALGMLGGVVVGGNLPTDVGDGNDRGDARVAAEVQPLGHAVAGVNREVRGALELGDEGGVV